MAAAVMMGMAVMTLAVVVDLLPTASSDGGSVNGGFGAKEGTLLMTMAPC